MKLPKLPKLRSRTGQSKSMPGLPKSIEDGEPIIDKVQPKSGKMSDTAIGRWFETHGPTAWGGRCARCGRAVPAVELERFIPPFSTTEDEIWACEECRKSATLSGKSGGPKGRKAKPIEALKEGTISNYKEQLESMIGTLVASNLHRLTGQQEGNQLGWCKWPDETPDRMKEAFTTVGHIANQLLKLQKEER